MHVCICIFLRSNSHSNICTLLKSVAHACVDCTQLLILPKPGCYFKVTYLQPISQAEVYQRLKNMACQHNKAFISLSFHPLPHKNGPKEPLGIAILTVLFFVNPQQRSCCRDFSPSAMWAAAKTNLPADRMSAEGSVQPTLKNKKMPLCSRVMRDRLWFNSDTVQALEKVVMLLKASIK